MKHKFSENFESYKKNQNGVPHLQVIALTLEYDGEDFDNIQTKLYIDNKFVADTTDVFEKSGIISYLLEQVDWDARYLDVAEAKKESYFLTLEKRTPMTQQQVDTLIENNIDEIIVEA